MADAHFGYVVSLRLEGRWAVVVGGGEVAVSRVHDLVDAGARVRVVTPDPCEELQELAPTIDDLRTRAYQPGDLADAAIAIVTREDPLDGNGADVEAFWAESRERGVLAAVLDDLDHCDFAAPALVRRGDLRIALSTAGRAPALAKRLRVELEQTFGEEVGLLVDVVDLARTELGARDMPFDEWATRWELALADLDMLLELVADGRADEAVGHIVTTIRRPERHLEVVK